MSMTRRQWMFGGASAAGLLSFGGAGSAFRLAHANTIGGLEDRYFIFCYFAGGWDILLGLDPRDPAAFPEETSAETQIMPGYDRLVDPPTRNVRTIDGIDLGPYIGDLAEYANKMCVVRGMSMETLTHQVGRRRFLTGKPPAGLAARGSSAATWLAAKLGAEHPIPNLSAKVESYNSDQAAYASALRVQSVEDLVRALRPGDIDIAVAERDRIQAMLDEFRSCTQSQVSPLLSAATEFQTGARTLVSQGLDTLFDFSAATPEMYAVREKFGIVGSDLSTPEAQAAMAVTALTAGISRVVSLEVASGLDTHFDNWESDQGPGQQQGFNVMAALARTLEETPFDDNHSWLDKTTILGFSEFSRTPMLNGAGGRDHSLSNACVLLGAGIKPGVVGQSLDVGLAPNPVDLVTGQLDPNGEIIRPEHVLRGLFESIGMTDDLADLRVDPLRAMLL